MKNELKKLNLVKLQKLLQSFINNNLTIIIFISFICLSILIIFVAASILSPSHTAKSPAAEVIMDGNSLNNPEKLNIRVEKESINPSVVNLKKDRFYDITFRKTNQSNCSGLVIKDLDIRIDFQQISKTVPFRINSSGEYMLECYGETSSAKIIVSD